MAAKKDPLLNELLEGRGPGAHLRNAREQAGMSVNAVAEALLLKAKTIELLEADAYDRLPAPTFVRGYLRGYARVLGLPSGPILDMYNRQGFEPPPLTNEVTESTQAHTSDTPVRLVTYAVAVVLVLLVGLWWHSQEDGGFAIGGDLFDWSPDESEAGGASVAMPSLQPSAAPADGEPSVTPPAAGASPGEDGAAAAAPAGTEAEGTPVAAASLRPDAVPEGGESASTSPLVQAPAGDIPLVESAPVAADGEASAAQEAQSEAVAGIGLAADPGVGAGSGGAGDENAPVPESSGAADSADESAGASLAEAPASETQGAAPGTRAASTTVAGTARSGLVLEFAHESWVEVYDRERTRLFFNLVQPGKVLSFDGPQPFDVLLGYGKDVRVTIDGEAFDHTPYLKYGVARFSVGSESAGGTNVAESGGATMPDTAESPAQPSLTPDRGG